MEIPCRLNTRNQPARERASSYPPELELKRAVGRTQNFSELLRTRFLIAFFFFLFQFEFNL